MKYMSKGKKTASFGKKDIPNISEYNLSANYEAKSWSEMSAEFSIIMYDTVPGSMEPVDMPSVTLDLSKIISINLSVQKDVCDHCGLPLDYHELRTDFIEEIKRKEKNKLIRIKDINSRLVNH
jgi:ribosomal protein L37E